MTRPDLGLFESVGIDTEKRTERSFIIGTRDIFWWQNPIGLRIDIVYSNEIGKDPRIAGVLFWNAQIRVVFTGGEVKTVKEIFAGYNFYPTHFSNEEIKRLEKQLIDVREEYYKLFSEWKKSVEEEIDDNKLFAAFEKFVNEESARE